MKKKLKGKAKTQHLRRVAKRVKAVLRRGGK